MKKTVTVRFPAPLPAEIKCPICDANKCKVCDWTGKIKVKVDAKVPIQRTHIIKYVAENMDSIAKELTRIYGLTPEIGTKEVIQKGKKWIIIDANNRDRVKIVRFNCYSKRLGF